MFPALALTARLFPGAVPADVLDGARAVCPALLRVKAQRQTLNAVSWSNLRIAALPGYEWSRSPLELARYARSRLIPGREALAELADGVNNQPDMVRIPWYAQPHVMRILRWLTARPPRVQTMLTVLGGQPPR